MKNKKFWDNLSKKIGKTKEFSLMKNCADFWEEILKKELEIKKMS